MGFLGDLGGRGRNRPGNSHRGAVLCLRQTRPLRERASALCDFRHAESRTVGAWLQSSNPTKNLRFLDFPFRFAVHREAVRRKVQGTQFPAGGLRAAPLKYPEGSMP